MDVQFASLRYTPQQIEHRYGDNVCILKNPLALSVLATLCSQKTVQPEISRLIVELYRILLTEVMATEFPRALTTISTRMMATEPRAVFEGDLLKRDTRVVVVALARAGLLPSQITYDFLNHVLDPQGVRQDHLSMGRTLDASGKVVGAGLVGSKIGGSVQDAMLLIPDPMGATGSTVRQVLDHYEQERYGQPSKAVALHLIVTPEYLAYVHKHHPQLKVYALRLDRGLSSQEVLRTIPGTHWDQERGLTDKDYIVPGAGGVGEVLNNSFV